LGSDPGIDRGDGRCATDDPGRARGEDLHDIGDAPTGSLPHIPGRDELIAEVADLVPGFIAGEAFLQQVAQLISERGSNIHPLKAAGRADDTPRESLDAPVQVCLRIVEQLVFGLTSLRFLLSFPHLASRFVDQALDERPHLSHGRRRAQVAERAFQIGGQPKSDLRRRVGGKLPLGPSDQGSEPGLAGLGVFGGGRDVP